MSEVLQGKQKNDADKFHRQRSEWTRIFLNKIEETLREENREVFSIPSVYEAAICFQRAFFSIEKGEKGEPANEIIKWRCLLAMLALQGIKHYPISFDREDFKACSEPFFKALKMQPRERLFTAPSAEGWSWMPFYIVKYENVDIAIFSPATILYPVVELEEKLKVCKSFPWYDKESACFIEPQKGMSKEEKKIVYVWLDELRKLLEDMQKSNGKDGYKINQELLSAVMKQIVEFQNVLAISDTKRSNINYYLKEIDETGGCFLPSSLKFNAAKFINMTIKPVIKIKEFETIPYSDVLENRLLYIPGEENPFKGCLEAECYEIKGYSEAGREEKSAFALLPFSQEFMNKLQKCKENTRSLVLKKVKLDFQRQMDEKCHISIKMDLTELDSSNLCISKKYELGNDCMELGENEKLAICIWPRLNACNWKAYYSYIYYDGMYYDGMRDGEKKYRIVFPSLCKKQSVGKHSIRTKYYPKVVGIEKGNEFLGVVCPQKEKPLKSEGGRLAVVAVDFGTTETRIRARIGEETEEIHLDEEHIAMVVNKGEEKLRNKAMRSEFLPVKEKDAHKKIFSIYQYFEREEENPKMLIDGNIYLPEDAAWFGNTVVADSNSGRSPLNNCLVTNIKWNVEAAEKYFDAFLMQLCMQTTAYLYKKYRISGIIWRYAVPIGMETVQIDKICKIWKSVCQNLKKLIGLTHGGENITIFEGYAASLYFSHIGGANYPQGFYSVDIGGGITDIALWQEKEDKKLVMCSRLSSKTAGRKILTEAVWDYAEQFLKLCESGSVLESRFRDIVSRKGKDNRKPKEEESAAVDRLIAVHGESINAMLHKEFGGHGCWVNKFRARLAMNIAMLMYCLGRMMGERIFKNKYEKRDSITPFMICIGGNGSRILDWVGESNWDDMADNKKEKYIEMFRIARAYEIFCLNKQEEEQNGKDTTERTFQCSQYEPIERKHGITGIMKIFKSKEPKEEITEGLLRLNEELIGRMEIEEEEAAEKEESGTREYKIEWAGRYTERFLEIFKEKYPSDYKELVNEDKEPVSGMIRYNDPDSIRSRVGQLYNETGNDGDASASRNIYECMLDHVLADFLNEDIRP